MPATFSLAASNSTTDRAAGVLAERLRERGIAIGEDGFPVGLVLDDTLGTDEFQISDDGEGVVIAASGLLGLLHGIGRFLRGIHYTEGDAAPGTWRGREAPRSSVRGTYYASHFFNYYHVASLDEMRRYTEDLALWGFNYIMAVFPHDDMTGPDDPAIDPFIERLNALFAMVHSLGMKVATAFNANSTYPGFPEEYRATPLPDPTGLHGNFGSLLDPAIPEANAIIMREMRELMTKMAPSSFDMITLAPYDHGGCGCELCSPWGGNGFLKASKQIFAISSELWPESQRCIMTWTFDTPPEGEWDGLYRSLEQERWFDYIQADSHTDFPTYPLEKVNPAGLPVINFPEVSMWGLAPWGGWGATALPERFTRLWRQAARILDGGFIYSEGIFEDVNKAVISQLYFYGDAKWQDTLREYASYELGISDTDSFIRMISLIEKTHTAVAETGRCDIGDALEAHELAIALDASMPDWGRLGWRWRIIYLRTLLDARRYPLAEQLDTDQSWLDLDWRTLLRPDEQVQAAFREIITIFKASEFDKADLYHSRVRPLAD